MTDFPSVCSQVFLQFGRIQAVGDITEFQERDGRGGPVPKFRKDLRASVGTECKLLLRSHDNKLDLGLSSATRPPLVVEFSFAVGR